MDFLDLARGLIGNDVEVLTANDIISGILIAVDNNALTLRVPPVIYGPPTEIALIPTSAVEFIRVVTE